MTARTSVCMGLVALLSGIVAWYVSSICHGDRLGVVDSWCQSIDGSHQSVWFLFAKSQDDELMYLIMYEGESRISVLHDGHGAKEVSLDGRKVLGVPRNDGHIYVVTKNGELKNSDCSADDIVVDYVKSRADGGIPSVVLRDDVRRKIVQLMEE